MTPRTHATLLWLAGLGGAAVLAEAAIGILTNFVLGLYFAGLRGVIVLLIAAVVAALVLVRARLGDDPPVSFLEKHP